MKYNETQCESCVLFCTMTLLLLAGRCVKAHLCGRDILIKQATSKSLPSWDNEVCVCVYASVFVWMTLKRISGLSLAYFFFSEITSQ